MVKGDCQDMRNCDSICDGEALSQRNAAAILGLSIERRQFDQRMARWQAMVEGQLAALQQIVDELKKNR